MKTRVSYSNCSVTVLGLDMACPLCGVMVRSGSSHQCSRPDKPAPKKRLKKGGKQR